MNPGDLDRQVEIYGATIVPTDSGDSPTQWDLLSIVWSKFVQPTRDNRPQMDGDESRSNVDKIFFIRWTALLAPGVRFTSRELRIVESGERFRITAASEVFGRRNFLRLEGQLITEGDR